MVGWRDGWNENINLGFSFFSAVFTWTNLLVVVVELDGNESEALDLVPLVTNTVSFSQLIEKY